MTLLAVQDYTQGILNGMSSTGWQKPLVAYVKSPIPGLAELQQPMGFIWGAAARETRTSIPRSAPGVNPTLAKPGTTVHSGWKERPITVTIWLYGVQLNSDPNSDTKFPVLIEQVLNALRMTEVPAYLVDRVTGEQSKLMNIGEEFSWEYDVDRTLADQRLVRNECRIDVSALEQFQF